MELIKRDIQISKDLIDQERQRIKEAIDNGELDALQLSTVMAMYNKLFEGDFRKNNGLKHLIKEAALDEFDKYAGEKEIAKGDCHITKAEVGAKYDYCNCNDPIWNDLDKKEQEIKKEKKDREKFLKAIKGREMIVDPDTGEMVEVFAPVKTSTTSLKFSFK